MVFKFRTFTTVGTLIGSLALVGYGQGEKDPNHTKAGVIAGTEQQVAEVTQKVVREKYGLDVGLVTFSGCVLPSGTLSKGDIDTSASQHKPYLDQQIKDRGYKLTAVDNTFVYLVTGHSKKIKSLDELQDGSRVAIPNDPTDLDRSLLLLQKADLVKLKDGVNLLSAMLDVIGDPKSLKLVELGALQLSYSLGDTQIALAVINTTYANQTSLTPAKDDIFAEGKNFPYVSLIVTCKDNRDAENVGKFVEAYQFDRAYKAANKVFNGGTIKGWQF